MAERLINEPGVSDATWDMAVCTVCRLGTEVGVQPREALCGVSGVAGSRLVPPGDISALSPVSRRPSPPVLVHHRLRTLLFQQPPV